MKSTTKVVVAPTTQSKIEIKDWITGEEAEYIDDVLMSGVDVKPGIKDATTFGKFNTSVLAEYNHRKIEKFVASIDGNAKNVLQTIKELPEEDYKFVISEIESRRKKKINPSTE